MVLFHCKIHSSGIEGDIEDSGVVSELEQQIKKLPRPLNSRKLQWLYFVSNFV